MTCRTIGRDAFSFVAIDAELHFDGFRRPHERKDHVVHVAVAILAGDFPQCDMPSVREVRVVGDPVYLDPWNRTIVFNVVDQLFFLFAVRHRFFMTILAIVDIGDRGFLMGQYKRVAVETVQFGLFYMLFMIIGNRLRNAF